MTPRHLLEDIFSTFIQFVDDQFHSWMTDGRLRRSIQASLRQVAQADLEAASETFWMLYWYRAWRSSQSQSNKLALGHLSAYLQETCYWAARKITAQITGTQHRLSDCFQIAIASLPKVLQRYDPNQGASLKAYASISFSNTIRDSLRQQGEADRRTDWGLLRKVSGRRLQEALESAGLSANMISVYRLAWQCFKTFCGPVMSPMTRQLPAPDADTWKAIANFYNSQRLTQLSIDAPEATPKMIEHWLKTCARYVRSYLHPSVTSLNFTQSDDNPGELLDQLSDDQPYPLAMLIAEETGFERKAQQAQVDDVLIDAINQLDEQVQQLIKLYSSGTLTQQQLATQLGMRQYTVSRRLTSAKESLLRSLAVWSQETLHIDLTPTVLKDMSIILEEWLQARYQNSDRHSP
jgi:RNA polymerase sigma factor (sigma-70 family)